MSTIDFLAGAAAGLAQLQPYDPGLDAIEVRRRWGVAEVFELSGNESIWGPSPTVAAALSEAATRLPYYPDPSARELKSELARLHGLRPEQFVVGNGSHELLVQIACTLVQVGQRVVAPRHGFAVFAIAGIQSGGHLQLVPVHPLDHPRALNAEADSMADAAAGARLVFIANPNNPTGGGWNAVELQSFLERVPAQTLVVIDEAYAEYVLGEDWVSALTLLDQYPNLIVTRTFSKAYGLASLRIGYAACSAHLAALLERTRLTFNLNHCAQAAAVAALRDREHLDSVVAQTLAQRPLWADALSALGLRVFPSEGNFLLVDFGRPAQPIFEAMAARGVLLRPVTGYGLPNCLRITIADQRSLDALVAGLSSVLAELP